MLRGGHGRDTITCVPFPGTGRAGKPGVSILLADALELRRASKLAVDRGFVFRTKVLEEGRVLEPPVEECLERGEKGEEEKRAYRKSRS